jgi:single-strand DNA-binding protein
MTPDPTTGGPRIWSRQDGSPGASFELNAGGVQFLAFYGNGAPEEHVAVPDIDQLSDDDIPF